MYLQIMTNIRVLQIFIWKKELKIIVTTTYIVKMPNSLTKGPQWVEYTKILPYLRDREVGSNWFGQSQMFLQSSNTN